MNRKASKLHAIIATMVLAPPVLQGCDWLDDLGEWPGLGDPSVSSSGSESDSGTGATPECEAGQSQLCALESAKGDCALGVQICDGNLWSACTPRFAAQAELCGARPDDDFGPASGDEDCDGQIDETDAQARPKGCVFYMQDLDEDGWGAIGPSYQQDPEHATYGCFCGEPPIGLKFLRSNGQHNRDCGDCADQGDKVYPGSEQYYDEASSCLKERNWGGGTFDYNCNGQKDYLFDARGEFGTCDYNEQGACVRTGDGPWRGGFPDCGEIGERPSCSRGPFGRSCGERGFVEGRTQYCR